MRQAAGLCLGGLLALASLTACWGVDEAEPVARPMPEPTDVFILDK